MQLHSRATIVERRGSALVSAVILAGVLTMCALVFLRLGVRVTGEQVAAAEDARALYLAEAAVTEAVEALRSGESGDVGSKDAPAYLGGGLLWVEATDLGNDRTQLDAMALKEGGRAALRVVVEIGAGGGGVPGGAGDGNGFFHMLFSNQALQLDQGISIDSYDSTLGTYASQAVNTLDGFTYAGTAGGASGNASVQLDQDTHVFGDTHSGPGYAVGMGAGAYVSGSTTPNPTTVTLDQIPVPVIAASGTYNVPNNQTKTLNSGTYHFTSMTQGKSSTLKVIGPATLVLDGYTTGKNATLELDCENGPITIYDTGVWSVDTNYTVGPPPGGKVDAAFLISSTGTVQFDQGSKSQVGFYAPNATIQVDQGAEVWGGLVADQINVNQNTKFHFDENLRNFELPWEVPDSILGGGVGEPEIVAWSRIDFPDDELRANRRDPFTLLGVQKGELDSPANSWQEP
jgi:hypothetical protein